MSGLGKFLIQDLVHNIKNLNNMLECCCVLEYSKTRSDGFLL